MYPKGKESQVDISRGEESQVSEKVKSFKFMYPYGKESEVDLSKEYRV